jgi:putative ATP-binding cassette transporter
MAVLDSAWHLLAGYWLTKHKLALWLLLLLIIMTASLVGIEVGLSYWYNYFYSALQEYNKKLVITLLMIFIVIAVLAIIIDVYRYYLAQLLALWWRRWLTAEFFVKWLHNNNYYYLAQFMPHLDNTEQRLQEDIDLLVNSTLDLLMGFFQAVTTILAFVYILWTLSAVISVKVAGITWHIHGYLVWVAIIYSLFGTYLSHKLGLPLIKLNILQQQREANLRVAAIAVCNNSEAIALSKGAGKVMLSLQEHLGAVLANWRDLIVRQKKLLWFNSSYNQVSLIIPLLATLPNYFGRTFLLGGLMQSCKAFSEIQGALSFIVNYYTSIAKWRSALLRLVTLNQSLTQVAAQYHARREILYSIAPVAELSLTGVNVYTPTAVTLLANINLTFSVGSSCLLTGVAGLGKSTLLKVIANLWPFASGKIVVPAAANILYVPQQPYFPRGTLREILLFTAAADSRDEGSIKSALLSCRLSNFCDLLDQEQQWTQLLSAGELQQLNFVRILLSKANWLILDESTSALAVAQEQYLYCLLKELLPQLTIISVAHRSSLIALHETVLDLGQFRP